LGAKRHVESEKGDGIKKFEKHCHRPVLHCYNVQLLQPTVASKLGLPYFPHLKERHIFSEVLESAHYKMQATQNNAEKP